VPFFYGLHKENENGRENRPQSIDFTTFLVVKKGY